MADQTSEPDVMTPSEVADIFGVNPKTVTRWARTGRLPFFTTLGGHRRFHRHDVDQLLNEHGVEQ